MAWRPVAPAERLDRNGRAVLRVDGRQVLVLRSGGRLYACNNRCPHEGYPLSEGTLSEGCVLTCNWHNWKFDLASGQTLVGGDTLVRYPVKEEGGQILIDWTEPDAAALAAKALDGLAVAVQDEDYQRIARELARVERHGGDPLDGLRRAIVWSHDRFEFGMTHAYAVATDWLTLRDQANDATVRLAALVEAIAYIGEDADEQAFPFDAGREAWDDAAFLRAIEAEDQGKATRLLRGALAQGMTQRGLRAVFARAALAHYQDFGHAAIYTLKAVDLAERLGGAAGEAALLALLRSLIYASREDLLPEFRAYAPALAGWGRRNGHEPPPLLPAQVLGRSAKAAMETVAAWSATHAPQAIYPVLLEAAAMSMLRFDRGFEQRTAGPIGDNIGWLDFTHALTFANATRQLAADAAGLWPAALLQLACFIGRNAKYVDQALDVRDWQVPDPAAYFAEARGTLYDHGVGEFIVSAHLVKTTLAAEEEAAFAPAAAPVIAAAVNRWRSSPLKRRHALRTARQMRDFVAEE